MTNRLAVVFFALLTAFLALTVVSCSDVMTSGSSIAHNEHVLVDSSNAVKESDADQPIAEPSVVVVKQNFDDFLPDMSFADAISFNDTNSKTFLYTAVDYKHVLELCEQMENMGYSEIKRVVADEKLIINYENSKTEAKALVNYNEGALSVKIYFD